VDRQCPTHCVTVTDIEMDQLSPAQAGSAEQRQERCIPSPRWPCVLGTHFEEAS